MKLSSRPIEPRAPTQASGLLGKRGTFPKGGGVGDYAMCTQFAKLISHHSLFPFHLQLLRYEERETEQDKRTAYKQVTKTNTKRIK